MDLKDLHPTCGQALWLDYIRRQLLQSGELARMVREDGIRGVTTNPSIFEKAIADSTDYAASIERVDKRQSTAAVYEQLAIEDIQQAADVLRPVYDESERRDGYVSMEVSPHLAHDTQGTIAEATRLWHTVRRDNLMVKVPGAPEGIAAFRQLIGRGINVNVTLLFSRSVCDDVAEAYMDGLDTLLEYGGDPARVASVASVFVSRLDVLVDPMLKARLASGSPAQRAQLQSVIGNVAIANAKLAYQDWKERCQGARWQALAARGARAQRLLWASTSTKAPNLSDVLYVEALIGPDTVDTIPPATLTAFRDHGKLVSQLEQNLDQARQVMATLADVGISIDELTARLLAQGVESFSASFDALMAAIEKKRNAAAANAAPPHA